MSNIVLTTHNRVLGLPVRFSELEKQEQIVATNAPMGMLFTLSGDNEEILYDYSEIEEDDIEFAVPLCLPLISDYKERLKNDLNKVINNIDELPE